METVQQRIEAFSERMSAAHEQIEVRLDSATRRKMTFAIAVNTALLLIGSLCLLVLRRYWRRAIALPLRQLAERSSAIAKGEIVKAVPIVTRDEIGLLSHAFNRMAHQLKDHEEKSKGLAILEERERLASELHDNLAQDLAFLRIKLIEWERSDPGDSAVTKKLHEELFPIVDEAYKNLREAIFGLRALALKPHVGLVEALGDFLKDFSEVRNIPVDLQVDQPETIRFSSEVEIQLIRILHEALTNIVKHAQARRAKITIENTYVSAMISIEDDGQGICENRNLTASLHFGLETMKRRAESVGGSFVVSSVPRRGTKVVIELPLAKNTDDENHSAFTR
jgi:nitrate/nitrite-specific signal transduction histidine kinase